MTLFCTQAVTVRYSCSHRRPLHLPDCDEVQHPTVLPRQLGASAQHEVTAPSYSTVSLVTVIRLPVICAGLSSSAYNSFIVKLSPLSLAYHAPVHHQFLASLANLPDSIAILSPFSPVPHRLPSLPISRPSLVLSLSGGSLQVWAGGLWTRQLREERGTEVGGDAERHQGLHRSRHEFQLQRGGHVQGQSTRPLTPPSPTPPHPHTPPHTPTQGTLSGLKGYIALGKSFSYNEVTSRGRVRAPSPPTQPHTPTAHPSPPPHLPTYLHGPHI